MKRFVCFLLIICMILSLCGCGVAGIGATEINDEAYAIFLGIDKGKQEGFIKLTVRVPAYAESGGGGGGEENPYKTEGSQVFSVEMTSISDAVEYISMVLPQRVSLGHVKVLIFSEEIAREGLLKHLNPIMRDNKISSTMSVMVAKGDVEEFILAKGEGMSSNIAREAVIVSENSNIISEAFPVQFYDFYNLICSYYGDGVCVFGEEVKEMNEPKDKEKGKQDSEKGGEDAGEKKDDEKEETTEAEEGEEDEEDENKYDFVPFEVKNMYLPGKVEVKGAGADQLTGMAVFSQDRMVGRLDMAAMAVYMMALGEFEPISIAFNEPKEEDKALIIRLRGYEPNIKVNVKGDKIKIDLHLKIRGTLEHVQTGKNHENEKDLKALDKYIKDVLTDNVSRLIKLSQKELYSDFLGLGYYAATKVPTIQEWDELNWFDAYKDCEITVSVDYVTTQTNMVFEGLKGTGEKYNK